MVPPSERERSPQDMTDPVREACLASPASRSLIGAAGGLGGLEAPVQINMFGDNLDVLAPLADRLVRQMQTIEGLVDVETQPRRRATRAWRPREPRRCQRSGRQPAAGRSNTAPDAGRRGSDRLDLAGRAQLHRHGPPARRDAQRSRSAARPAYRSKRCHGEQRDGASGSGGRDRRELRPFDHRADGSVATGHGHGEPDRRADAGRGDAADPGGDGRAEPARGLPRAGRWRCRATG